MYKAIKKYNKIPVDPLGYYNKANKNKPVIVPSSNITMKGLKKPIKGTSLDTGEEKIMYPNEEYIFEDTNNVLEQPLMKSGGMIKRADGSDSKRGLWDNIRANKGSGKNPTAQMLEQERKIKMKTGGFQPLFKTKPISYSKTTSDYVNDFDRQIQANNIQGNTESPFADMPQSDFNTELSTAKNAFAYTDEEGQIRNPKVLDTSIAQTSFPKTNLIQEEANINNSILNKKAPINKDSFTEKKETIEKNNDYSYIPSLVNGVLGAMGNRLERNRQDEYTHNNLANPFNYLPVNSNTNNYVNKGVQIAEEGGFLDEEEDDWDFEDEQEETQEPLDDSLYLSEELMSQQEDEEEPLFIPEDEEDIDFSVMSDNTVSAPTYNTTANNNTLTDESGFDLYMKHQQGASGYPAIKKAAETGTSWRNYYKGDNLDVHMKANVYADFYKKYKALNESNFLDYWKGKYQSKVQEGANKKTVLQPFIEKEAAKYGFTPEYVKGIINIESGFDPKAKSGSYKGLLQLDNEEFAANGGKNIYDPFDNIRTGLKIIASKRK